MLEADTTTTTNRTIVFVCDAPDNRRSSVAQNECARPSSASTRPHLQKTRTRPDSRGMPDASSLEHMRRIEHSLAAAPTTSDALHHTNAICARHWHRRSLKLR